MRIHMLLAVALFACSVIRAASIPPHFEAIDASGRFAARAGGNRILISGNEILYGNTGSIGLTMRFAGGKPALWHGVALLAGHSTYLIGKAEGGRSVPHIG